MPRERVNHIEEDSANSAARRADGYDPFLRGPYPVGVRTLRAHDAARGRLFPFEVWYPATAQHAGQDISTETQDSFTAPTRDAPRRQSAVRDAAARPGTYPLVIFSHSSGAGRLSATFLCTHLGSHGYLIAAMDHSEVVAPELTRRVGETDEQKAARWQALIDSRVPDVRFLLGRLLGGAARDSEAVPDPTQVGVVGHSLGGWTALAAPDAEPRIRAVVALAPGGASRTKPGILPVKLTFGWGRDIPTLYLVAENDASLPLDGMYEIFDRTPATKQMLILRRADHMHFMDDAEQLHEAVRTTPWPGDLSWLPKEMRPISELCPGDQAHLFTRGLALSHLDATLKQREEARRLLAGNLEAELATRGVAATLHRPSP